MWKTLISIAVLESITLAQADIGCYVRGECVQSPTVESADRNNVNDCLAFCKVSIEVYIIQYWYCTY